MTQKMSNTLSINLPFLIHFRILRMNIRDRDSRRGREQRENVPHLYVWVYIQDCPGFTTCITRGWSLRARARHFRQ